MYISGLYDSWQINSWSRSHALGELFFLDFDWQKKNDVPIQIKIAIFKKAGIETTRRLYYQYYIEVLALIVKLEVVLSYSSCCIYITCA